MVREDIVLFAVEKLLNPDPYTLDSELTLDQVLACLSQRFHIQFNWTTAQAAERKQVKRHMRVCIEIDSTSESMETVSTSEPLLSEAAYFFMSIPFFDAPKLFKSILEEFLIHTEGDRGEFVPLLLLTPARDEAVSVLDDHGHAAKHGRLFDAVAFVFRHPFREHVDMIQNLVISSESAQAVQALQHDFPDPIVDHFIEIYDCESMDKHCLLLLMIRGAGILCDNNLGVDNFGLILYQITNDSSYTDNPKPAAFVATDPYELGILKDNGAAILLMRVFFALAATNPRLVVTRHEPTSTHNAIVHNFGVQAYRLRF